jgi:hypothetical protein
MEENTMKRIHDTENKECAYDSSDSISRFNDCTCPQDMNNLAEGVYKQYPHLMDKLKGE